MDQTQACLPLGEAIRRWKVMAFCVEVKSSTNLKERRLCSLGQYRSFFNSKAMLVTSPQPQGINLVYPEPPQSSDLTKRASSAPSGVKQTPLGKFWPAYVSQASCAQTSKPPSPSLPTSNEGWANRLVFPCWQVTCMQLKFGDTNPSIGLFLFKKNISCACSSAGCIWRQWFPHLLSQITVHTAPG